MSGFSEWLFGKPDKLNKVPSGSPQQEAFHNNILSQAMNMNNGGGYDRANDYYNNLLGPNRQEAYDQFSQPYLQQFEEQMLPRIAERFARGGALSSSGFGQALGGATSNLQSQLAQLFSQLQGNAAQSQYGQYNQLAQTGLNYSPFDYVEEKGNQGFLGNALGTFGNAMFGSLGGMAAQGISSLFKKPQENSGLTRRGIDSLFKDINRNAKYGGVG
jgi:hypothetical protein